MPTSDIFTGLNDTDILAMQQDTQSRMNDIFNNNPKQFANPNGITQPEAPKGLYGTVNPGENINIDKTSMNYNAASYDTLAKKTQASYPDSFKQLPDILLPQSETRRYTGNDFGFDVTRDNEDFYNGKQNAFAEVGKSIFARLPLLTISKLGTGIGYLLGLANPANWGEKNYISSAADNSFAKFFEGMEDKVKNDWLPVYQSAAARNMGFFERAFKDQTFWAGDVTDAAAFMASAFIPGLGISKLGLGAKVAALAGMAEGEGLTASAEYLTQAGLKLARNVDVGLTTAVNTASESMFEAKQVRDDVYNQLMATGKYTDQEAKNVAGEKARNSFLSNLVALSASNLWESNIIFKALGKKVEEEGAAKLATTSLLDDYAQKTPSTKVGKFLDGKLGFYGKKALEGVGVEGFYEENIQQAIQRYNENTKNTNSNDSFLGYSAGVLSQMWQQTKDSLSGKDKENAMNIGVGGLIGGLFGMPMSIISKEYSEHHGASKTAVDALNVARNNWLKIQDIYSVDAATGKIETDYAKAAAILFNQAANTDKLDDAQKAKNPVNREVAQKQLFASLVASHLNNDSFDKLIDQMNQMKSWKPEDLVKLGFDTDKTGVSEKIEEYKRYAENIKELKEMIDKVKPSPSSEKGFDQYRKNQLFQLGSTREALETEAGKIGSKISQLESKIGRGDVTDSFVNEINSLKLRIASQQATIEDSTDTHKPIAEKKLREYQNQLDNLLKDNEETLKDLKSDKDGFLYYRNNDKNNHPLVNELHDSIAKRATLRNAVEDVSDEFNKHLSDKSYSEGKYKEDIDNFTEYVKKAQEQSNKQDVEQNKELPEPVNDNQTQTSQTQTPTTTQPPAPVQTQTSTQTQVTPAPTTTAPVSDKQQRLKDLFNKYQVDLNAATTQEQKDALKQKYIKDALAINSEGTSNVNPKETARKTSEIKNLIPKGSTINKDELSKIFGIISNAVKNGEITPEQENELTNTLNDKKVVGTIFNTEEDLEDENSDVTENETNQDENPDTEVNQNDLEENLPDETNQDVVVDNDFDPNTNDVDTSVLDQSDTSPLAFMTSNKTVTQEETQDDNGRFNNRLDEDPYKQFIQGYLRHLQQAGILTEGLHGKIIKDNDSLPHSESTKVEIASGKPYGSVLVITDMDRNILHFDDIYDSLPTPKEGFKPIVFSFTQHYWDSLKNARAALGEERTGISAENFLKMYQTEKEQQELARQLNDQGKEVFVEIKGVSNGVIRKVNSPVKASDVIKEEMNSILHIPSAIDKYDPNNPEATKFVLVGNRALLNGALYAQMTDKNSGYISNVRLIPNLISDMPDLFKQINSLLNYTYNNENEAITAKNYLKDVLFLGKVKRPTLVVTRSEDNEEFNIRMIQDGVMIDPEATIDFVSKQRLNVKKDWIESDEADMYTILDKKLHRIELGSYKDFILNNSTTVDIPVQTSEGNKYLPLNTYATFDFMDSPDTMKQRLSGQKESAPEGEMKFNENETPVFRHGQNNEDITAKNSGTNDIPLNEQGIKDAISIGKVLKDLGKQNIVTSPILRALQTGQQAASVANIKNVVPNHFLKTWDIGDFTSKPDSQFDERWFVTHPDDTTKDGMKLGESFNSFLQRAIQGYKFISENTDNKTAIISHSRNIRVWNAMKLNNGYWNENALETYLNQTGNFNNTSIPRVEKKADNSTLTKQGLRKLGTAPVKSTEQLAREQDEEDKRKLFQYQETLARRRSTSDPLVIQVAQELVDGKLDKPGEWKTIEEAIGRVNRTLAANLSDLTNSEKKIRDRYDELSKPSLKAIVDTRENLPLLGQNEIDHVNRIFGYEVAERVNEIVNSNARALWTTSGISLYRDARKGDAYHEAWHHFSQLYLTQNEKRSLYDEARKKNVDFTTRDGRKLNSKTASDFDIEEFMADDFRDYVLSDGKSRLVNKPYRNNIFRQILDFLKRFFFGDVNIAKLYDDLSQGNLYSYTPSINNAMWGKLNSRALDKNGNEIVDNQKAAYYRDLVDYHMGEQLLLAKTSVESLRKNKKLAEAIYTNIYNDLVNRYYNPMLDRADKGEQINQQVAEDLFNILSNWEAFVQYHKKASKLFLNIRHELAINVPENPEDVTEENELGGENYEIKEESDEEFGDDSVDKDVIQSDKLYDVAGNEQSSIQAASVQTRGLIRMLPSIDYDGGKFTVQMDVNGFPRLNDYARTWNNIAYELANLSGYPEMIQKLRKPDVQKKIPEVVALLRHLPDPDRTHTPAEINTILAFRTDFNRAYIGIFSGKMYPNGSYFMNEETKRNNDQVKKVWTANFFNKLSTDPEVSGQRILIDEETGKYYLNPSINLTYNIATLQGREDLMKLIGMNFSDEAKKNAFYVTSLPNWLKEIQNNINLRHQNGIRIYNPTFDVRGDVKDPETGETIIKGLSQVMEGLTNFQATYAADVPSLSYQTAEGEMIYGLSLNHTLSIVTNKINKANTLDDIKNDPTMQHLDQVNNPNVRGSIFLRTMFGINGNRIKGFNMVLGNYNGFKQQDIEGNTVGYSTTSLNVRQKAIFDISSLLSRGMVEVMRTESSKSAFFIKLNKYTTGSNPADQSKSYLPIAFTELPAGFESPKLMGYMIDYYLNDELVRMKGASDVDVYKTDPKLMQMAQGFNLFRDILRSADKDPESLKNDIKSDLETKSPFAVIEKHRERIEQAVVNFFNRELVSFKETLAEENITAQDLPKNLPSKTFEQQLRTFIANDFLLNVEYTKLFNGDTIYQAHYKDYFKRSKGDISTGKSPMTDDLFVRHMQSIEGNTFGAFIGSTIPNDYKTFRTLNFKDDKRDSKYLEIYKKDLLASDPKLDPAEIDRWLEKYKSMNVADGQGYITLDFYRQFLKSIDNWSDAQEMGYQVELAKYRLANKDFNQDYTNEMRERDREFLKANPQNFSYYPPLKIQYNGPIKAKGTYAPVMDKFSVVPMIPSILQNTPLEQMNNEMLKAGIHYAKYESGTKKYKHPPIEIYNEDGFTGLDLSKHTPAIHFLDYLKEQINTNPKIKEESIFGSQIRKLIEANIFSSGNATAIDIERHNRYKSYLKGIADLGRRELFDEIGLKEQDGRIRIGDMEKFISTIQEQAELRELNDNIKDYIQMDQNTKKLKYALETSLNRRAIQDMLMGLVDRRLRVQKLSGDQLIQISSSGYQSNDFKYRGATNDEVKKYGTNGLRFYHLNYDENGKPTSIKSAQVKVALIGSFEKLLYKNHPDGTRIGTLERLNELLKNDDWVKENQKSITLVGYRIPTQGHNSMEHLQVAEFLPPHAGSVVIVPAEIVAKSGSDFDIDKLSIFRPSFDDNGELINDESKEGYSNKIINLFSEILSDPKIFKSLIRPNDTDLVKPETNAVAVAIGKRSAADAKEAKPYSGTQIYRYKSNLRKFETLLSAKRLLSIFAVNNTFTTVMQQAGTQMNMSYGINGVQRMVKLLLMSPQERAKITKDGKLDLANRYSVDGTFKQDYYSQLINATVDAASDDFFGYVNMSYENVNVLCHLINQGVPFNRAIWFLNQPVLLRYYSDMRRRQKGVSKDSVKATILGELTGKSYFKETENGRVVLNKSLYNKDINEILNNPKYANLHLTTDTLKKYTKKIKDVDAFLNEPTAKSYNSIVFAYFITLQEQAGLFRDLQKVSSYDTVKTSSPTVAWSLFATTQQINANEMFDPDEVNKIADRSVIGAFDNKKLIATIGAAMMPVAFNPYFMQKSVKMIQDNTMYATKPATKKFINNYETQWIEYVIKSLGKIGQYSLPQYAKYLQEGTYSLARRFNDMVSKYPDLKQDYALVSKLRPNFPNTNAVKKSNIEVSRLFENTTDDQNRYIAEFRNLINEDSPKYTAEQNNEIHKFFKDLAILGFIQSGFSKSNISFQELVPYEELADIFKTTIDNFMSKIAPDKSLLDSYIGEFQSQFNSNLKGSKQPWRGRDYFLSEKIDKGLKAKMPVEEQKKTQVNTQPKPQPNENVVQQKFETKPQTVEQEQAVQEQMLTPEVKTERQYWPGYEIQESANEFTKAMGKADFKYAMDQLNKTSISYLRVDLDKDPNNIDWDEEDDWYTLKSENFEHAMQIAKKFNSNNIFTDINGDETTLDEIGDTLSIVTIGDPNGIYTEYYGGLSNLLKKFIQGNIDDEDLEQVEKLLADYGLLKYRDYNPNQLRIPFPGEDSVEYNKQINKVLGEKDKGC